MRLLSRYIAREIAVPALLALIVVGFLSVAMELRERDEYLALDFLTLGDIARLAVYFLPTLVVYIIPMAYMLGILLAFGSFSQHNELTAMKAAGIPMRRFVLPVIVGGGLLGAASFLVQDQMQPWALNQANRILFQELPRRMTLDALQPGVMHPYGDWRVYFRDRDPETGTLYGIDIVMPGDDGVYLYHAPEARFAVEEGGPVLHIPEGHVIPPPAGDRFARVRFSGTLDLPALEGFAMPRRLRSYDLAGLFRVEEDAEARHAALTTDRTGSDLRSVRLEIAERMSYPLASLAVAFVAAPLGARAQRRGRSYSFAVGAGVFLCYYLMMVVFVPRSLGGLWETVARALAPNLVLIAVGLGLLRGVDRV
jgi:lipopolysaccharide export system permease protein